MTAWILAFAPLVVAVAAFLAAARPLGADSRPLRQQADGVRAMALYALDRNDESEALIAALHRETMPARARRVLLMADATQRFRRGEHDTVQHAYAEVLESSGGNACRRPTGARCPACSPSSSASSSRRCCRSASSRWRCAARC
jgi:hypothetical protein